MRKIILPIILLSTIFLTGCTSKSVVLIDTDVKTAEQVLIDTVNLYDPVLTMLKENTERHTYAVRYNCGTYVALPTSNLNININPSEKAAHSGTLKNEGGFSCNFRQIDSKNTLVSCRKISPVNVYIFNHYEKFFKELKNNGIQYVSYKTYLNKRRSGL